MWPFRKKPEPPKDCRVWNEDWQIGDVAEVVGGDWSEDVKPWHRLPTGSHWTVNGFKESRGSDGCLYYFLSLEGLTPNYSTQCFRKVRPIAKEQSEIVERILNAKPGKDKVKEPVNESEAR